MSNNVQIQRDFKEETKIFEQYGFVYQCYQMYLNNDLIGRASYRNKTSYWYIDEFLIFQPFRGNGYGTYLLDHITEEMWNTQKLPIDIDPSGLDIPKEDFIAWLTRKNFISITPFPALPEKIMCRRLPPQ